MLLKNEYNMWLMVVVDRWKVFDPECMLTCSFCINVIVMDRFVHLVVQWSQLNGDTTWYNWHTNNGVLLPSCFHLMEEGNSLTLLGRLNGWIFISLSWLLLLLKGWGYLSRKCFRFLLLWRIPMSCRSPILGWTVEIYWQHLYVGDFWLYQLFRW